MERDAVKEKCLQQNTDLRNIAPSENVTKSDIQYRINESPPFQVTLLISMQHLIICFASALTLSSIIADILCAEAEDPLRSTIFSTALLLSGLNTIAQSLLGSRLPVFQGPSFTFISPLIALGTDPTWTCSNAAAENTNTSALLENTTVAATLERLTAREKLQQMSGSLMAASMVEVVIGMLGIVGPLMRLVGPITVAPTITLIGLSLYKVPIQYSRPCPPMAAASAILVLVFSLYLQRIQIPIGCGKAKTRLPIFQILPVLLSMCLMWTAAGILTACGVFPDDPDSLGYMARTDARSGIVARTPWLIFTYPGQFGMPKFNIAAFVGFSAAVLSSVIESVGDYLAAARSCEVPPPPQHAVSRGVLLEGIGSVLSGAYGAGHATATYSGNIALLSLCRDFLTRVQTASRSVLVVAGILLVAVSFVGKLAAGLSTIPEPILGGIFLVIIGILVAIGVSTLKHVDLNSTRNIIIIGVSIFIGVVLPDWIATYPESIDTGNIQATQVIRVLLGTPMILGGVVACFLDNTVQGSFTERGLHKWTHRKPSERNNLTDTVTDTVTDAEDVAMLAEAVERETYGWRWYPALRSKCRLLRFLPFLPPHVGKGPNWSAET